MGRRLNMKLPKQFTLFGEWCACGNQARLGPFCKPCYDRRWRDVHFFGGHREKVIARDRVCVCGAAGEVIHHRRPGVNGRHVLIYLCRPCHARIHHCRRLRYWVPRAILKLWEEINPSHRADQLQIDIAPDAN